MRVESDYLYQRYSSQEKLKLIADKIKYSDPVSMDELEDEEKELALLLTQMEQLLQNNEVERFESMVDEFLTKLERRNNLVKCTSKEMLEHLRVWRISDVFLL